MSTLRGVAGAAELARAERLWLEPQGAGIEDAWARVFDEIDEMIAVTGSHGSRFAVVIYPYAAQLADPDALRAPQDVLATFLRDRDVPALDLLGAGTFAGLDAEEIYLDANHLTSVGTAVAATTLARFLVCEELHGDRPTECDR